MFKYFGLFLVLLSWAGGYFLVSKWYDKNLPTISMHAASNRRASRLFAITLILLGLTFFYWLIKWFVPYLELTFTFQILLAITILCQIIAALIPDTNGWRKITHRWAAYTMAVLYLPLSILIIISPQLPIIAQILCCILFVYMLTGFILVAMMGRAKSKYLIFQSSYIVAFQLIIMIASYTQ